MFVVTYLVFVKFGEDSLDFERSEELPFVPFRGLDIEDDALGEFEIERVRWSSEDKSFYCQSNYSLFEKETKRTIVRRMKKGGWQQEQRFDETNV